MSRACRTIDVEREKKPIIMYTIEGAYINKDSSLIGEKYQINDNEPNNNSSLTDTFSINLHVISLNTKPVPSKAVLPTDSNDVLSLPFTRRNIAFTLDTASLDTDENKTMMHRNPFPLWSSIGENAQLMLNPTSNNIEAIQTINYDRYPPPPFLTKMNTSSAPTTIRSNSYRDNIQQPIDPLELASLSQSTLLPSHHLRLNSHLLESTVRQAARPWTKHSRWVLRLAQLKRIHTHPLTSSRPLSREQPNNSLTLSTRSTSTIPRYVVYQE